MSAEILSQSKEEGKKVTDVTVTSFLTEGEKPQFRNSGILPLVLIFSVTLLNNFFKRENE